MKFLSTLFLASIAVSPAIAQNQKTALKDYIRQHPKHYQMLQSFMNQNSLSAKMKTTGTKQRVIASSGYELTGGSVLTDSTNYFYNGNNYRGSSFDYNMMTYDLTYSPANSPSFSAPSFFGTSSPQQPLISADSIVTKADNGSGLDVSSKEYSSFVNNTQISDYKYYDYSTGTPDTGDRYISTYDAQNRINSVTYMRWSGMNNGWDTVQKRSMYYNAQGVQQNDSIAAYNGGVWTTLAAFNYVYNGSNLAQINGYEYDGTAWNLTLQYVNTYTSGNQLQTSTYSVDNGSGTMMPLFRDTFGYTNNSAFCTYWESLLNQGSGLQTAFVFAKHLNSQGLPDSTHVNVAIAGIEVDQKFTYNANNNPILELDMLQVPMTDTSAINYYYEDYNDLAVNNVPKATANITVYPNPSNGMLNIRWDNYKTGTPVSIRIINAAGQTVHAESFSWKQTTESLSMGNLQAGIYWISIADNAGNMLLNQSVIKQ